jgi:DNA-binding transcriptional LysR family regulator
MLHPVNRLAKRASMDWGERIGRRLKLRDLHILFAVVECGSMARAAKQLSVSNPVISKAIASLEHTLGVRLLDRDVQGTQPTVYGRALLDCGLAAFGELRQAVQLIESLSDPTVGEVKLASSLAIASGFIPAVVARLIRRFPRIRVDLLAGEPATSYRALEERRVDLAILHRHAPIARPNMHWEQLYQDAYVVVAASKSAWARRRKIELADLMNEPWVLPPPDSAVGSIFAEAFVARGLNYPRAAISTQTMPARAALASTGSFLTILPNSALKPSTGRLALKALPIDLPTTRRPTGILRLSSHPPSPAVQHFVDCAREVAKLLNQPPTARRRVAPRPDISFGRSKHSYLA